LARNPERPKVVSDQCQIMRFRVRKGANLKQLQMLRSLASVPPIPRDPPSEKHHSSDRMVTYKLSVQPGVPGAPEVKKAFPKFGAGGESDKLPEEYSEAVANIISVWDGLAIGNGPGRKAIVDQVLIGSAKRNFEAYLRERGAVTTVHVRGALQDLGELLFGRNHRARQLSFLRGPAFQKPRNMSVQAFANRMEDFVAKYETVFGANSLNLDDEAKKDIFEKAMPVPFRAAFYNQERELADMTFRTQVAMYARFEAAQEISESVTSNRGNAQQEWLSRMPGQGSATRLAATRRGARGRGQVIPPHRQAPVRDGDQRQYDRGNFRNAVRREARDAIPPQAMQRPMYRPNFDPVQRPFRPQFQRNQRRAFRREANVIERQPNPNDADSDIGF